MEPTVTRTILDRWIDEHGPDGLLELARKSKVSSSTIIKARLGRVPKKLDTRRKLFKALGVTEDELFPLASTGGRRAS